MTESSQNTTAKRITWAARITGLIGIGIILILLVIELVRGWYLSPETGINIAVIFFECLAIAGIIVSWWRALLAGILLAVACVGLSFYVFIYTELAAWLVFCFPYLVSSILFFVSWKLARQTS